MEAVNILSADVLDIIFDARNKEYGAYDLRKHYQQRLVKSLLITLLIVVLISVTYILLGSMKTGNKGLVVVPGLILEKVIPQEKKIAIIPPPQLKITPPIAIRIRQFTKPLIVTVDPPENERPPLNDDLINAKIGKTNTEGLEDVGIVAPVDDRKGVAGIPQKQDDREKIFIVVQMESQYPGGMAAWSKFLYQHLIFPQEAADIKVEGTVMIQFVVDTEGNVSDVTAVSGPEELRATAINVIKKSGKWTPAIQNGRQVKSYKRQPITFRLPDEQ